MPDIDYISTFLHHFQDRKMNGLEFKFQDSYSFFKQAINAIFTFAYNTHLKTLFCTQEIILNLNYTRVNSVN